MACLLFTALLALLPAAGAERALELPLRTRVIGAEAFLNVRVDRVMLPESVQRIGSRAFVGCGLRGNNLPGALTEIAADSFQGCGDLVACVDEGSYAQAWCKAHGLYSSQFSPAIP